MQENKRDYQSENKGVNDKQKEVDRIVCDASQLDTHKWFGIKCFLNGNKVYKYLDLYNIVSKVILGRRDNI